MKILAIGASNNRRSINRVLAAYAAQLVSGAELEVLDIHDYELPIFSDKREQRFGQPLQARNFFNKIGAADGIIVSFAEHNGSYTAAFKNLFDWASRIDVKVFQDKPAIFLATSPGPGGAKSVLASAVNAAPFFGAQLIGQLSIPKFHENFDVNEGGLINELLLKQLQRLTDGLRKEIKENKRVEALLSTAGYPFK